MSGPHVMAREAAKSVGRQDPAHRANAVQHLRELATRASAVADLIEAGDDAAGMAALEQLDDLLFRHVATVVMDAAAAVAAELSDGEVLGS